MRRVLHDPSVTGAKWTEPDEKGWRKRRYRVTVKTWDAVTHYECDAPADMLRQLIEERDLEKTRTEITIQALGYDHA